MYIADTELEWTLKCVPQSKIGQVPKFGLHVITENGEIPNV